MKCLWRHTCSPQNLCMRAYLVLAGRSRLCHVSSASWRDAHAGLLVHWDVDKGSDPGKCNNYDPPFVPKSEMVLWAPLITRYVMSEFLYICFDYCYCDDIFSCLYCYYDGIFLMFDLLLWNCYCDGFSLNFNVFLLWYCFYDGICICVLILWYYGLWICMGCIVFG